MPSFQFITLPLMHPLSGVRLSFTGTPLYICPFSKKWHQRVDVRDRLAVVAHLVVVRRAAVGDGVGDAVENAGGADVGGDRLRLGMRERHHDPALDQLHRAGDLLRRDQVRRALGLLSYGAHLPQVLNSVRHCSYWARSAAVSAGGAGAAA